MNLSLPLPPSTRILATLAAITLLLAAPGRLTAQTATTTASGDLLKGAGAFEKSYTATTPWGGVDSGEYLRCTQQEAPIVLPNGEVDNVSMPTSVAVADMNNDKLPDLVVADPAGFLWVFLNSGTPTEPKFTSGDIIPIWIPPFLIPSSSRTKDAIAVNKITVTDFNDDGRPDLVIGTFQGELYFLPNIGSPSVPKFSLPTNAKEASISTRTDGKLWGNFFSPIYVDFTKSNRRDLILGEGTYSANSIYYFPNAGTSSTPRFSDKTRQVLIRGMGREHLTPQMIDWNNDGIPDIITGERSGAVSVFICKSNDPKKFEFAEEPIIVKFGSSTKLGSLSNPVPADLNGDGLFDLVVGRTNGRIAVAYNKGKPGEPAFDMPVELKGVQKYPKYAAPSGWKLTTPPQSTFHVFRLVGGPDPETLNGAEKDRALLTYEKGFSPNPDSKGKYAGKLEFLPNTSQLFPGIIPLPADLPFVISCESNASLKPDTDYTITFYAKGSGWTRSQFVMATQQRLTVTDPKTNEKRYKEARYALEEDFNAGGNWSKITKVYRYRKDKDTPDKEKPNPLGFGISVLLFGKGTFYIDDLTIEEKK